jgi:molybdopterin converting factor subunit 1
MTVTVRLFASLRERAGCSTITRTVANGTTAGDLFGALCSDFPALEGAGRIAIAVNEEYTDASHRLAEGDEVALIPPVSGGMGDAHDARGSSEEPAGLVRLTDAPIVVDDLLHAVADPAAGAVVLFIGTTRDHNEGRQVERLEYEAYAGMAESELRKIVAEARSRWSVAHLAIVHRTGVVPIGSASVAIAASAAHRADAFAAARFAIDRLKEVVPIWKKEFFAGGAVWIGDQACRVGTWQEPGPSGNGGPPPDDR